MVLAGRRAVHIEVADARTHLSNAEWCASVERNDDALREIALALALIHRLRGRIQKRKERTA